MDETYRKTAKMDPNHFSTPLGYDPTDIVKIMRDCLLEGADSLRKLKAELYKLTFYGTCLAVSPLNLAELKLPSRPRRILQVARRYPA
jgi:hypothetical protein